jgi:arginyl-tRNA synthetase
MEKQIKELLLEHSIKLFGSQISDNLIQFQPTRKDVDGDLTLVVFPFVKILRCSPEQAGEKIGMFLSDKIDEISSFEPVRGFLNISLSDVYWLQRAKTTVSNDFGMKPEGSAPLMMVEYASPNTNKPLHLGHLRNIFLGDSVASILKANGHDVIRTQIINDRGIHICKSMLAWERFSPLNEKGERETPQNTGMKGDKLVGKYYVEFDKQMNQEVKGLITEWESGNIDESAQEEYLKLSNAKADKNKNQLKELDAKIKELAKTHTSLLKAAKEMLIKWEARDPQVYLLWTTMNGWVYAGFEQTYDKMGVNFDKLYYESDTFLLGKDVVDEGLKKGVFYRKQDGSVWIDLTNEGLDEKIVLRSDGTAVYMTQDIGTAIERYRNYPDLKGMVYTVGNEQDYHFKVLFLILKKLGYVWADNCFHLSYGMVDLPTGKMKSREGTVVDADELMDDVINKAAEMTKERGHLDDMIDSEKEELYHQIGLAGLKYYLVKVDPKKRMMFDPQDSIDLNGNTGPFIQYTHARICSLLMKAGEFNAEISLDYDLVPAEKELIKLLNKFPIMIEESAKSYSPAVISNYCYELVKAYNYFYQNVKILPENETKTRNSRLTISKSTANVINRSLNLLGIYSPSRM